jgi:uncharacterized membrane protein SpoIIM required for sporulation
MRETKFIEQNKEKWAELEDMVRNDDQDPGRMNDLFIQITDDLSYARTYYPNRSVRIYLNSLAQKVFHNIYKGKRFPVERLRHFWTEDLPRLMWEERRILWLSFGIFMLAFGIGLVSSMIHPEFARVILGDEYVEMTNRNIANGDPMAVYKESRPLGMTLGIALNNLRVSLMTATMGILASLGTVFILLYNGIMVGAFQYFFIEKGLFKESFLTIWIHGTLEISTIIIAGAAGLVAGSGLLFPGTYTRTQAFQRSLRRAMQIFFGVAPLIVLAAIFEGFLTRFTQTPDLIRLAFILASLAFVLLYFVWYPWFKARRGDFREKETAEELPPDRPFVLSVNTIKSGGEIVTEAFNLCRKNARLLLLIVLGGVVTFMSYMYGITEQSIANTTTGGQTTYSNLDATANCFRNATAPGLRYLQAFLMAFMALTTLALTNREITDNSRSDFGWTGYLLRLAALMLPAYLFPYFLQIEPGFFGWLTGIVALPLLSLWAAVIFFEDANPITTFFRALGLIQWSQAIIFGILGVNLALMGFLFLDTGIWSFVQELFSWLIPPDSAYQTGYIALTSTFFSALLVYFSYILFIFSGAMLYFSSREVTDASGLKEGISHIGTARKIRGVARE